MEFYAASCVTDEFASSIKSAGEPEQRYGHASEHPEVLRPVIFSYSTAILIKYYIQHPV
jgi:hypothetical protein